MADFPIVYNEMLNRYHHGLVKKFNEEAHFLSYLFYKNTIQGGGAANKYIKRMWNAPDFYNIQKEDVDLAIWHLPAGKQKYALIFNKGRKIRLMNKKKIKFYFLKIFLTKDKEIIPKLIKVIVCN